MENREEHDEVLEMLDDHAGNDEPSTFEEAPSNTSSPKDRDILELRLSKSLHMKLKNKAQAEGISIHEMAAELLAEGLVLRAWEIMERKSTMRGNAGNGAYQGPYPNRPGKTNFRNGGAPNGGGSAHNNSGNGSNRGRWNGNGQQNGGGSGYGRRPNPQAILEDSANFIEYVRSQEKKPR